MKYSFVDLGGFRAVTQCPKCEIYYAFKVENEHKYDQMYRLTCPYCSSSVEKNFLKAFEQEIL